MQIIIVSSESNFSAEIDCLKELFQSGLPLFHLRKPTLDCDELANFIEKIPNKFHQRIVVHSHFSLCKKYNLRGIHLPEKTRQTFVNLRLDKGKFNDHSISTSCHNLNHLDILSAQYDYVFLSPIFDSISKNGYRAKFDYNALIIKLSSLRNNNITALGGINRKRIIEAKTMGFRSVALLGEIWGEPEHALDVYSQILATANNHPNL